MNKYPTLFMALCLCVFTLLSCAPSKKTFSNSANWIPGDFNPREGVLLVEEVTWPSKQGRIMREYMEEKYPYKYEFVSTKDLQENSAKYSDKSVYRFAIVHSFKTHLMHQYDPSRRTLPVGMVDFSFYDRLNAKAYPQTGKGSSLASVTFRPFINTVLEKFQ